MKTRHLKWPREDFGIRNSHEVSDRDSQELAPAKLQTPNNRALREIGSPLQAKSPIVIARSKIF